MTRWTEQDSRLWAEIKLAAFRFPQLQLQQGNKVTPASSSLTADNVKWHGRFLVHTVFTVSLVFAHTHIYSHMVALISVSQAPGCTLRADQVRTITLDDAKHCFYLSSCSMLACTNHCWYLLSNVATCFFQNCVDWDTQRSYWYACIFHCHFLKWNEPLSSSNVVPNVNK